MNTTTEWTPVPQSKFNKDTFQRCYKQDAKGLDFLKQCRVHSAWLVFLSRWEQLYLPFRGTVCQRARGELREKCFQMQSDIIMDWAWAPGGAPGGPLLWAPDELIHGQAFCTVSSWAHVRAYWCDKHHYYYIKVMYSGSGNRLPSPEFSSVVNSVSVDSRLFISVSYN